MTSFAREIGFALRPHFFALSGIAALAGAAGVSPRDEVGHRGASARIVAAAIVAALGWGVGQLLNDLLDRETDSKNAPDRAIAAGRLPQGPTLAFAAVLGIFMTIATIVVDGRASVLLAAAIPLLVFYNFAKRFPLGGHAAYGALLAVVAALGAGAAIPASSDGPTLVGALHSCWPMLMTVAAISAWYLQANYEKDRVGDRAAGYATLAVVLSVRASAVLRAMAIVAVGFLAARLDLLEDPVAASTMLIAVLLGLFSTVAPLTYGTDAAALGAYRIALPASILAMSALAAPLLGRWGTTSVVAVALALVWMGFRRSPNP